MPSERTWYSLTHTTIASWPLYEGVHISCLFSFILSFFPHAFIPLFSRENKECISMFIVFSIIISRNLSLSFPLYLSSQIQYIFGLRFYLSSSLCRPSLILLIIYLVRLWICYSTFLTKYTIYCVYLSVLWRCFWNPIQSGRVMKKKTRQKSGRILRLKPLLCARKHQFSSYVDICRLFFVQFFSINDAIVLAVHEHHIDIQATKSIPKHTENETRVYWMKRHPITIVIISTAKSKTMKLKFMKQLLL